MTTSIKFPNRASAQFLSLFSYVNRRQVVFGLLLMSQFVVACSKPADTIDPALQSPPPTGIDGKWTYGTFSPSSFWGTDGSYNGAASEQAMAFNFSPNGSFEMYVMNVTTYYNCRTGAYTYWKGKVKFNEADQSVTLTPTEGKYRGEYGCTPSKNFNRAATASEVAKAKQTFYYAPETDTKGKPALRIYFSDTDNQGAQFSQGNW